MVSEKSLEEKIMIKAQQNRHLARYMSSTQDLVEEQIRKAKERGEFDNLEGKGKPIDLSENPFEPVELRMAFKILKDNDCAPFWIELGKEIDAQIEKFWKEVEHFKRYTEMVVSDQNSSASLKRFNKKKASFYFEQRLQMEKIVKKIVDYNLHCPTFRLGRPNLDVDDEMLKVITEIEAIIERAKK
jgi:DnaJ family protein C protein 28